MGIVKCPTPNDKDGLPDCSPWAAVSACRHPVVVCPREDTGGRNMAAVPRPHKPRKQVRWTEKHSRFVVSEKQHPQQVLL